MSLWQTESWQEMLLASGQIEEYFVVEQNFQTPDSQESGVEKKIFVEKRRVSLGEFGLFMIGFEGQVDERIEESLQELCIEEKCMFVQIETLDYFMPPPSFEKGENWGESGNFQIGKYYKKFIPPYTAVIDLTKSEEDILACMKPKGRYNIKLAAKKGVEVQQVEKTPENIQMFHTLMLETTSRDGFTGNNLEYYERFLEQETSFLCCAFHEGEVIAAGIFIQDGGVMYYYYGASSNHKRNLMAPYALQWFAISYAKSNGYTLYDFLGIAGPDEKDSSLTGVTDFKLKLTPDSRYVSTSYLYVYKTYKHKLIQLLKYFKK